MPKGRNHISLDYFFLTAYCGQDVDGTLQELQLVTFVMTRGNKKKEQLGPQLFPVHANFAFHSDGI